MKKLRETCERYLGVPAPLRGLAPLGLLARATFWRALDDWFPAKDAAASGVLIELLVKQARGRSAEKVRGRSAEKVQARAASEGDVDDAEFDRRFRATVEQHHRRIREAFGRNG
jgi:hypothetical protein